MLIKIIYKIKWITLIYLIVSSRCPSFFYFYQQFQNNFFENTSTFWFFFNFCKKKDYIWRIWSIKNCKIYQNIEFGTYAKMQISNNMRHERPCILRRHAQFCSNSKRFWWWWQSRLFVVLDKVYPSRVTMFLRYHCNVKRIHHKVPQNRAFFTSPAF